MRTLRLIEFLHASGFETHLLTCNHGRAATRFLKERTYRLWTAPARVGPSESWPAIRSLIRRGRGRLTQSARNVSGTNLHRRRDRSFEKWAFVVSYDVRPAAVLVPFAWNARVLDRIPPDALGMLDTIDVQHIRRDRAREIGGDLETRHCTREEERIELARADVLIAIQREEAAVLAKMCPGATIVRAGHACQIPPAPLETSHSPTLLFTANLYDPNVRGIQDFLRDVWPSLRARVPDARLLVCGLVCSALSKPPAGVRLLGYVPDLEPMYEQCAALINPVPYSTGFSVKASEALARGRCVVASPAGVRGLNEFPDLPVDVVETTDAAVEALSRLLLNVDERKKRERNAWDWARRYLAKESVFAPIATAMRDHAARMRG